MSTYVPPLGGYKPLPMPADIFPGLAPGQPPIWFNPAAGQTVPWVPAAAGASDPSTGPPIIPGSPMNPPAPGATAGIPAMAAGNPAASSFSSIISNLSIVGWLLIAVVGWFVIKKL